MRRAVRFVPLERLAEMRRQASALIVREAARADHSNPPKSFEMLEAALAEMATRIRAPARYVGLVYYNNM